ncbi:MAG: diguanylate cyclase [Solirubrobacterales bacterium]|nr:diguanylate cyclase [Solirubrobacterales bacterium]
MHSDRWSVFDQAPGPMAVADADLVVARVNEAFCRLVGHPSEAIVGLSGYALMPDEQREAARARIAELLAGGEPYAVDQRFTHADGNDVWLRVRVGLVRGPAGERLLMAHVEDTTDHRRVTQRLRQLADRDHLTGLLNRRRLEEELETSLAGVRRHGHVASLIVIDLDDFKRINDRGGHEAGDRTLCFVAAALATRVRADDVVARTGGDEFAILLRGTELAAAEEVAAEMVSMLEKGPMNLTMSAGVAALTPEATGAQSTLHAADLAMYAAKAAGRNRVMVGGDTRVPAVPAETPRDLERLLGGLQSVADAPSVEHTLRAVRELLGMDISYVTMHTETEQVFLSVDGAVESFGVGAGTRLPLEATYCQGILTGTLPGAMPDVRNHPVAGAMPVTESAGVGAFVSVPIRLSDGSLYGTLCAASHTVVDGLGKRDLQFLGVLARLVAGELERDAALRAQLALRVEAAGAEALISAIEARDRYTGEHSREVVELAAAVAAELGLPENDQRRVAQVALLHDIGKLSLPDSVLGKPGPLNDDEIILMRRHPEDGERIVAAIPELAHLAPSIRAEHERWDGSGYPDGLSGEEIPIESRIVFVCDAWDAMTSDRPYRASMPRDEALAELADGAASQFCGRCVTALFAVLAAG